MRVAKAITNLTEAFERLPGIGPKSAARLTYYLLHVPQPEIQKFADALVGLKLHTKECEVCHNIAETTPCDICADAHRDVTQICVVGQPLDVLAMERGGFSGRYHVLHGLIDPMHNIGPDEIRLSELMHRLSSDLTPTPLLHPGEGNVREVILALNLTMEGEATCLYIKRQIEDLGLNVKVSRIAQGLPMGSDVEYADDRTISLALAGRRGY